MRKIIYIILIASISLISCKKKSTATPTLNLFPNPGSADLSIGGTIYSNYTASQAGNGGSAAPSAGNYPFSVTFYSNVNNGDFPLNGGNPLITIYNTATNDSYYSSSSPGNAVVSLTMQNGLNYVNVYFINAKFFDANNDTIVASGAICYPY